MTAGTVNTLRAHAPLTTCLDACRIGIDNKALRKIGVSNRTQAAARYNVMTAPQKA